jgi:hypothetical protein
MKMEQCSETSAYKIQTPGITQKKAYNMDLQYFLKEQDHLEDVSADGRVTLKCILN